MPVYHYGEQRHIPICYELMEDAARYPAFPDFRQPALIFHGTRDPLVPIQFSSDFVREHENARLIELETGHELTDVLDEIWLQAQHFLVDPRPPFEC
jgi:pimeloyl-ACP methyl ester carboxylesterase